MSAPAPTIIDRNTPEYIKEYGVKIDYCVEDMRALKHRVNQRCREWGLETQFDALLGVAGTLNQKTDYQNYSTIENYVYFNMAQLLNVTAEYELDDGSVVPYKIPYIKVDQNFNEAAAGVITALSEKAGTGANPDLDVAYSEIIAFSDTKRAFELLSNVSNPFDKTKTCNVASDFLLYTQISQLSKAKPTFSNDFSDSSVTHALAESLRDYNDFIQTLKKEPNISFAPSRFYLTTIEHEISKKTALLEGASAKGYIPAQFMLLKDKNVDELTDDEKDKLLSMARKAYVPAQQRIIALGLGAFEGKIDDEELAKYQEFISKAPQVEQEDATEKESLNKFLSKTRNRVKTEEVRVDGSAVSSGIRDLVKRRIRTAAMDVGVEEPAAKEEADQVDLLAVAADGRGAALEGDAGGAVETPRPAAHRHRGRTYRPAAAREAAGKLAAEGEMAIADIIGEAGTGVTFGGGGGEVVVRAEEGAAPLNPVVPAPPPKTQHPQGHNVGGFARGRRVGK